MRRILFIGFFLLGLARLVPAEAGLEDNWIPVSSPTNNWLRRCTFVDTSYGWAVGQSGTIIHSSNGGESWTIQESPVGFHIADVSFVNRDLGWAVSTGSPSANYILRTFNGGVNWISSPPPDSSGDLGSIFFLDSLNGFLGTQYGIMETTDGGVAWSPGSVSGGWCRGLPVWGFRFFNSTYGFAVGGAVNFVGVVWRTSNSGNNWNAVCISPDILCDIVFVDSLRVVAAGWNHNFAQLIFVKSSDGGLTWILSFMGGGEAYGARIARRTFSEFWIAPSYRQWNVSIDTARTWFQIPTPDNRYIFDVLFKTPTFGIAVGSLGAIYKYNPTTTGIIPLSDKIPDRIRLLPNYPNPFNPRTKIKFDLPTLREVRLLIYDMLGREVTVLINDKLNAGTYETEWNATNYPSGVYLYKLTAGDYTETRKMVLLK